MAQFGMIVRSSTERPEELAIFPRNRMFVDARVSMPHQTVVVEFPVLIAIGTDPGAAVVVVLVGEADGDTVAGERPQFLDQPILEFFCPLPAEERLDRR